MYINVVVIRRIVYFILTTAGADVIEPTSLSADSCTTPPLSQLIFPRCGCQLTLPTPLIPTVHSLSTHCPLIVHSLSTGCHSLIGGWFVVPVQANRSRL